MNRKILLFILPLILTSSYFLYKSYSYPFSDFANYYFSARFLINKKLDFLH